LPAGLRRLREISGDVSLVGQEGAMVEDKGSPGLKIPAAALS